MLGVRSLTRIPARQMCVVVSGPPRVRISFGEKVVHGLILFTSFFAIPSYVMCNLENYKNHQ